MKPVACAAIDIETSSLDKRKCEIREIALVPLDLDTFEERTDVPTFVEEVRCEMPQDPEAFAIHSIPADRGYSWRVVASDMAEFVRENWGVARPGHTGGGLVHLVGHNIGVFDAPVLDRCMHEAFGLDVYGTLFHYRVRDTSIAARLLADAGLLPPIIKNGKLHELCAVLDLPELGKAHRALPDARDEARVYREMIYRMRVIGDAAIAKAQERDT